MIRICFKMCLEYKLQQIMVSEPNANGANHIFYTKIKCVFVGKVASSVDDPDQQVTRASACLLEVT